jgi:hypothetical protein
MTVKGVLDSRMHDEAWAYQNLIRDELSRRADIASKLAAAK